MQRWTASGHKLAAGGSEYADCWHPPAPDSYRNRAFLWRHGFVPPQPEVSPRRLTGECPFRGHAQGSGHEEHEVCDALTAEGGAGEVPWPRT